MSKQVRVGVALFIWKNGKFLIYRRMGSHGAGSWSVPGGHLEVGESFEDAARRETLEEVGVTVKNIRQLAVTNDIFPEDKHYVSIWLEADWANGEPASQEPDKVLDIGWTDFANLPSPLFEPCWQNLRTARPDLFPKH